MKSIARVLERALEPRVLGPQRLDLLAQVPKPAPGGMVHARKGARRVLLVVVLALS